MHKVVFLDKDPDWIQFSNAGNLRNRLGLDSVEIEKLETCNLSNLGSDGQLYLIAHGSPTSAGPFERASDLATVLEQHGLAKTHKFIKLETCSSAADPDTRHEKSNIPHFFSFAHQLALALRADGYASIQVEGGTAPTVVMPGRDVVVDKSKLDQAAEAQARLALQAYPKEISHANHLINSLPSNANKGSLALIAAQVQVTVAPFFTSFGKATQPLLKTTGAWKTH